MNTGIRIKSLNGDTFTLTVIKDGKTFMEEIASYIPPSEDEDKNKIAK